MLPPDSSPVHRIVLAVRALGPVTPVLRARYTHAGWRAAVWNAADQETILKRDTAIPYNPSDDGRIKWLLQWCDVLEGIHRAGISSTSSWLCLTIPLDRCDAFLQIATDELKRYEQRTIPVILLEGPIN